MQQCTEKSQSCRVSLYRFLYCLFTYCWFIQVKNINIILLPNHSGAPKCQLDPKHWCVTNHMSTLGHSCVIFTAQAYARTVLGVVILSVRPSICHMRDLWQNWMTHCRYFDTTRKGNHSATLTPTVVGGRRSLPFEMCAQSDPPPREVPTSTDFCL